MTPDEALLAARTAGIQRRFRVHPHAQKRANQRGAAYEDIRNALITATSATFQTNGRWKLVGRDLDNEELICVVAIEDDVLVVTLF